MIFFLGFLFLYSGLASADLALRPQESRFMLAQCKPVFAKQFKGKEIFLGADARYYLCDHREPGKAYCAKGQVFMNGPKAATRQDMAKRFGQEQRVSFSEDVCP